MPDGDDGSVTLWLGDLKAGKAVDEAASHLWRRYFDRLAGLARARLRSRSLQVADDEDIALSAFDSFCRGAAAGRFPDIGGRDEFWRLLITITSRKAADLAEHHGRLKRGGGRVANEGMLRGDHEGGQGFDCIAGREPSPEFAAMVVDECRRLMDLLPDDTLRRVALLRMEGYENAEIASRLGCALRTVERKLDLIRRAWMYEPEDE